MKRLHTVETPTKNKRGTFQPQKNTLDRYFSPPSKRLKENTTTKKTEALEDEESGNNLKNNVGVGNTHVCLNRCDNKISLQGTHKKPAQNKTIKKMKIEDEPRTTTENRKTNLADGQSYKENIKINHKDHLLISNNLLKKKLLSPEKKKISGKCFKDIIFSVQYEDFCLPYNKLNNKLTPECCNPLSCQQKHKNTIPMAINTISNGPFFNILDNPLTSWVYDISSAAFSVLRPEQYFRGDVLRILFDYVLSGPSEDLMWDIKHILSSHFEMHPPCTEQMRQAYLQLLIQAYSDDCYFKTELASIGVLNYVINKLEEYYQTNVQKNEDNNSGEKADNIQVGGSTQKITFDIMEERYNNFLPLLHEEYNEVMDALDNIAETSSQEIKDHLNNCETLERLTIALELIIDLLEADFLICVTRLKRFVMDGDQSNERQIPLIKHFMDSDLHIRVFKLYAKTTEHSLWSQLSRLIGMMGEQVHMFSCFEGSHWQYLDQHRNCDDFTTTLFSFFRRCVWGEEERLLRLQMLNPPWLRLQVAMTWANTLLNLETGKDLKALVEIIHMHVKSPIKLEKDIKKVKQENILANVHSETFLKKAVKRNHYGETLLHSLCKRKASSMAMFHSLLALPQIDVNVQDHYGWTPLHEAISSQSFLKTKTLLQYQPPPGAKPIDIGIQNCKGSTPLHEAVSYNNLELCRLLVDYGGVCLLRKMDSEGTTPLKLAKENLEINRYFEKVLKTQELLNLSSDSVLNLPENLIQLLIVACDAYISDHHTWKIYRVMKFDEKFQQVTPKHLIVMNQNTLLSFKNDQDQFRKLRRILEKLSENPKNSTLVGLWYSKFQNEMILRSESEHITELTTQSPSFFGGIERVHSFSTNRLLFDELLRLNNENFTKVQ